MNSQTVTVNLIPGLCTPAVVRVSQYDVGRPLTFKVLDGTGTASISASATATVTGTKPSGLGFTESGTIAGNTVTLNTTLAMTQERGKFPAEIRFTQTGEDIGTANFILAVEPSPHPDGTTDGTQETMASLETRLQSEINDLSDRIDDIEAGGSGLSQTEKNLILTLFSKAAYAESDAETAYDQLEALWASSTKTITYNLSNVVSSNTQTSIESGQIYTTALAVRQNYTLNSVTVTMGGVDVTSTTYSSGTVSIPSVTGNIVITATAVLAAQSITATYTQSRTVYDTDTLDSLKADLVVTANYAGGTSETVPASNYTLSGTLAEGTSTITVSYAGLTDTFSVTVAQGLPSGYTAYDYAKNTTVKSVQPAVFTGLGGEYGSTNYEHYLEIAYESGTNTSGGVFGARQTSGTNENSITIWHWAGTGVPFFQPTVKGTAVSGGIATTAYRKNTFLLTYSGTSEKVYWNDELVIDAESGSFNLSSGIEFALFKAQTGTSKTDTSGYVTNTVRIYKYRVRNRTTGEDVAYMIPCTDSNGNAGFYDLARQSFYTARGGATYLAVGND